MARVINPAQETGKCACHAVEGKTKAAMQKMQQVGARSHPPRIHRQWPARSGRTPCCKPISRLQIATADPQSNPDIQRDMSDPADKKLRCGLMLTLLE